MIHGDDPQSYSIVQYLGVIILAVWGGIVNYWRKIQAGARFSITELVGEVATSGFAGIITFYVCEALQVDPLITAATVGIAGHMGGRTIILLEKLVCEKLRKRLSLSISCEDSLRPELGRDLPRSPSADDPADGV